MKSGLFMHVSTYVYAYNTKYYRNIYCRYYKLTNVLVGYLWLYSMCMYTICACGVRVCTICACRVRVCTMCACREDACTMCACRADACTMCACRVNVYFVLRMCARTMCACRVS